MNTQCVNHSRVDCNCFILSTSVLEKFVIAGVALESMDWGFLVELVNKDFIQEALSMLFSEAPAFMK